MQEIYQSYKSSTAYASNDTVPYQNYLLFLPQEIYNGSNTTGTTLLYQGTAMFTGSGVWTPTQNDITPYLNGFNGSASDLSIGSILLTDGINDAVLGTDYTYSFSKSGNRYYLNITALTIDGGSKPFLDITDFYRKGFNGAKDNCDFKITETDYKKDALEVPVFEYCCQIDDTSNVEIGEDILENEDAMIVIYDYVVVNKNKATKLNASKFFHELDYAGDPYVDDIYSYVMEVYANGVDFQFDNNTQLKMKFYADQTLTYYFNNEKNQFVLDSRTLSSQASANQLKNKDIIIYKHLIKSMTYDSVEEEATINYDSKLVMIIHGAPDSLFTNDELAIKINHYRLK